MTFSLFIHFSKLFACFRLNFLTNAVSTAAVPAVSFATNPAAAPTRASVVAAALAAAAARLFARSLHITTTDRLRFQLLHIFAPHITVIIITPFNIRTAIELAIKLRTFATDSDLHADWIIIEAINAY
jgi:hypothetical protein